MQFGLGVMRLPPDAFWKMTLPEIAAATGKPRGAIPDASALRALMNLYPDKDPHGLA